LEFLVVKLYEAQGLPTLDIDFGARRGIDAYVKISLGGNSVSSSVKVMMMMMMMSTPSLWGHISSHRYSHPVLDHGRVLLLTIPSSH